jgi:hypothetical protein
MRLTLSLLRPSVTRSACIEHPFAGPAHRPPGMRPRRAASPLHSPGTVGLHCARQVRHCPCPTSAQAQTLPSSSSSSSPHTCEQRSSAITTAAHSYRRTYVYPQKFGCPTSSTRIQSHLAFVCISWHESLTPDLCILFSPDLPL